METGGNSLSGLYYCARCSRSFNNRYSYSSHFQGHKHGRKTIEELEKEILNEEAPSAKRQRLISTRDGAPLNYPPSRLGLATGVSLPVAVSNTSAYNFRNTRGTLVMPNNMIMGTRLLRAAAHGENPRELMATDIKPAPLGYNSFKETAHPEFNPGESKVLDLELKL